MSFLYPLGLLGLVGIPILIVIYIIKSKYTEQTVSSTYLWHLAERFLKKKKPISRVTGLISLILQILAVAAISLAIAHPTVIIPDVAKEYCFILDGSGSMNMESDGKTRFERGKEEIEKTINESVDGSIYSLIYVGEGTNILFEKLDDKEQALFLLSETKAGYGISDMSEALGVAQGYFNENPSLITKLISDKSYAFAENLEALNLSNGEQNYGISDCTYIMSGHTLTVTGNVVSYESDASLTLSLYVDGENSPRTSGAVVAKQGQVTPFQLVCESASFSSLRVAIDNPDALALDNEAVIYDIAGENTYSALLVSERPLFLRAVLSTILNTEIEVITPEEYKSKSGYGLYVFDSCKPEEMPRDGAVWIVNPTGSIPDSGFSVQSEVILPAAVPLERSDSTSSTVQKLTADMSGDTLYVSSYIKCGLFRNFTSLYSYKGSPLIFAGTNSFGNREVVFAFDLHNSNLPLLYDYMVLARNFIDYSFPDTIEKSIFNCGEEITVNVPASCRSIRVDTPDKNVVFLDTNNATSIFVPTEVGIHTLTVTVGNSQTEFKFYAGLKEAERRCTVAEEGIALQGNAENGGFDGKYDTMTALFIIIALLFIADWGVYCYEKYQLR